MGIVEADTLQKIIENASQWPIWGANNVGSVASMNPNVYARAGMFGGSLRDLAWWVALREGDRDRIKSLLNWPRDREYRFDPLPARIASSYSDLLFGEDPEFVAPSAGDQTQFDEMIEANDLPSELRRWSDDCISEGEIWWRIYVDKDISDWPIVDAASRLDTIPLFIGRRVGAVAFFSDILSQEIEVENQPHQEIYRHIEIQTDGLSRNLLYKGGVNTIGNVVPLETMPETAGLPEEWNHGLSVMLAGRVPNKLGRDWRLGISEYNGVKDLLLDLNEAHTIMAENARNTAKARMVVPASALDKDGNFDAGKDVIVAESLDEALDAKNSGPYAVLEYHFQADPLLKYMDNLINTILTRCGLAEQFVQGSKGSEGQAFTGTALRTRLIPTTLAAAGKARFWDDATPKMLQAMIQVANLPSEKGGLGRSFSNTEDLPVMKRSSILPEDLNEETQRHVMAVQGEIESIETAVRATHPDWTDEEVEDEIERIHEDRAPAPVAGDAEGLNELDQPGQGVPGSPVPGVQPVGARQPGAGRKPDGQSPGKTPATNNAGGPS